MWITSHDTDRDSHGSSQVLMAVGIDHSGMRLAPRGHSRVPPERRGSRSIRSTIPCDVRGREYTGDGPFSCFINSQGLLQQMLQKTDFRMHHSFNKSRRDADLSAVAVAGGVVVIICIANNLLRS